MAFKVLDREEVDLLSDEQREQYEKELNLYQQRVAFVERLEELENVRLEPYKPKLESISVTNEIEVAPFKKEEYTASLCEPVQKPDLQVPSYKRPVYAAFSCGPVPKPEIQMPSYQKTEYVMSLCGPVQTPDLQIASFPDMEQISPVLPVSSKTPDVRKMRIKKVEAAQPDIPFIGKVKMTVEPFKQSEWHQAKLPAVIGPSTETILTAGILIDASVKTQPSLPDVSVSAAGTIAFQKPEKQDTELPVTIRPYIEKQYAKKTEVIQPVLPETAAFNYPLCRADFRKPEQCNIDLPIAPQAVVSVPAVSKTEKNAPDLPKTPDIDIREKKFSRPKQQKPDLPEVSKPTAERKSFEKNIKKTADLPILTKSVVYERTFESPKKKEADIMAPKPPHVAVKAFAGMERRTPGLPEINISKAPDAYLILRELLAVTQ